MGQRKEITQERIGIHPKDWKLSAFEEQMLLGVDDGIRDNMRLLCAGGFQTYESCQGGAGHAYTEPTIRFHGQIGEGYRAISWLLDHGVIPQLLSRIWYVNEYGELAGPEWQITFNEPTPSQAEGETKA